MGYALGSYFQLVMVFGPGALILFSKRISGWGKVRWVFFSLLPWLIAQMALVAWMSIAPHEKQVELMMFGSGPIYIATWVSAWLVYFMFRFRFKKALKSTSTPSTTDKVNDAHNEDATLDRRKIRYGIGLFTFALILSPLAWTSYERMRIDAQMETLCKKDGGMKIYEQVLLPKDQFTKYGDLVFHKTWNKPGGGYQFISKFEQLKLDKPTLNKTTYMIVRETDLRVLGTYTTYYSTRGIMPRLGPDPVKRCPEDISDGDFLKSVFIPIN